jgi:1-deoxy-D-xylulose-5-phosphate synthase
MAAGDELELMHMIATCATIDDRPSAVRYPRGEGVGLALPHRGEVLPIGKGRIICEGNKIAILNFGTRLGECRKAVAELNAKGLSTTLADARFAKPLDAELVEQLARNHEVLITIEEGSICGFGAIVLHHLADAGLLDNGLKVRTMTLPDIFQDHESPVKQYDQAGLNATHIVFKAMQALGVSDKAMADPRVRL